MCYCNIKPRRSSIDINDLDTDNHRKRLKISKEKRFIDGKSAKYTDPQMFESHYQIE